MHGTTEWALTSLVFLLIAGLVIGLYSRSVLYHRGRDDVTATNRRHVPLFLGVVIAIVVGGFAAALFHWVVFAVSPPA